MCKAHQPGPKLGDRLRRLSYYWLKMVPDASAYAKRCHACSSNVLFMAIWDVWNENYRTYQPPNIQRTSLHLGHNRLLL